MEDIDWPEKIRVMQRNWIGRSEGVTVAFDAGEFAPGEKIETFTTRIDTIYGVTFVVLAPEHRLVDVLTQPGQRAAVDEYVAQARRESEIERTSTDRDKTGVPTGAYCTNPLNGERVPVLVGDYVLATYGSGAVMGVPAHDVRDFDFAKKYGLPIRVVVAPDGWQGEELTEAWVGPGTQTNSGEFDGLPSSEGMSRIADKIEANGWGRREVTYHMRDWLISRQRYWGTPIPIVYCEKCGAVPVPEDELPVLLPEDADFKPTGQSPLTLDPDFVSASCPKCGAEARRETDTMDTFVDSSWYHLRYTSPTLDSRPFDPESVKSWSPVHQYTGGMEHAVMHLLYARFFTKALRDMGFVDFDEPYARLFSHGVMTTQLGRISKRKNPLAPDPLVEQYGADTVRCYLMFLGPWDTGGAWTGSGINGVSRWMNRIWDLTLRDTDTLPSVESDAAAERDLLTGSARYNAPGHRGHGRLQVQHVHRRADGVHERTGEAVGARGLRRGDLARRDRTPVAPDRSPGASHHRGALGTGRARGFDPLADAANLGRRSGRVGQHHDGGPGERQGPRPTRNAGRCDRTGRNRRGDGQRTSSPAHLTRRSGQEDLRARQAGKPRSNNRITRSPNVRDHVVASLVGAMGWNWATLEHRRQRSRAPGGSPIGVGEDE